MSDPTLQCLRLLQYLSLMLLFGLPLLQWQAGSTMRRFPAASAAGAPPPQTGWLWTSLVVAALANAVEWPLKTMRLMGMSLAELDGPTLAWYLLETPAGLAWLVRGVLLLGIAALCWRWRSRKRRPLRGLTVLAGLALLTLLWNGHAGASTGIAGGLRLVLGGAHLLAAAAWLGAIAGFLTMLARHRDHRDDPERLAHLHASLHDFSRTGTALVLILISTGVLHLAWIADWNWSPRVLVDTDYGRWMLFKLALFTVILALAAVHRWILVPRLARGGRAQAGAISALRNSIRLEAGAAVLVVAAVAILGTMSPHG